METDNKKQLHTFESISRLNDNEDFKCFLEYIGRTKASKTEYLLKENSEIEVRRLQGALQVLQDIEKTVSDARKNAEKIRGQENKPRTL